MGDREKYEKGRCGSNDPFRKHDLSKSWDEITGDSIKQLEKDLAGASAMVVQTGAIMCVCSYVLPHATSRSLTNILLKQDQFPTIKECKQHIEEKTGYEIEEVVLMNWKEVNNDYEL